jgi:hypothetical protein
MVRPNHSTNTQAESRNNKRVSDGILQEVNSLGQKVKELHTILARTKECVSETRLRGLVGGAIAAALKETQHLVPRDQARGTIAGEISSTGNYNHPRDIMEDPEAMDLLEE